MQKFTIWERWNFKTNSFEHNHIEEGWIEEDFPKPISKLQIDSWRGATWNNKKAMLINGRIEEVYG